MRRSRGMDRKGLSGDEAWCVCHRRGTLRRHGSGSNWSIDLATVLGGRAGCAPGARLRMSLDEHPGQDELCDKFLGISVALSCDGGGMRRGV